MVSWGVLVAMERLEVAVRKEGEVLAVAKERFEPGCGEGRRGLRLVVGNWEPAVEEGERSWDMVESEGDVGDSDGINGEPGGC